MITGTVTNKEYALFLKETGQTVPAFSEKEADYPVVNVSYRDAVVYSKRLFFHEKAWTMETKIFFALCVAACSLLSAYACPDLSGICLVD